MVLHQTKVSIRGQQILEFANSFKKGLAFFLAEVLRGVMIEIAERLNRTSRIVNLLDFPHRLLIGLRLSLTAHQQGLCFKQQELRLYRKMFSLFRVLQRLLNGRQKGTVLSLTQLVIRLGGERFAIAWIERYGMKILDGSVVAGTGFSKATDLLVVFGLIKP